MTTAGLDAFIRCLMTFIPPDQHALALRVAILDMHDAELLEAAEAEAERVLEREAEKEAARDGGLDDKA